jgi:hypothetical protein
MASRMRSSRCAASACAHSLSLLLLPLMLPPCRASLLLQEDDAYCAGDGYANPAKVKVPTSLPAALDAFEADEVLKAALGEQFSTWYVHYMTRRDAILLQ